MSRRESSDGNFALSAQPQTDEIERTRTEESSNNVSVGYSVCIQSSLYVEVIEPLRLVLLGMLDATWAPYKAQKEIEPMDGLRKPNVRLVRRAGRKSGG